MAGLDSQRRHTATRQRSGPAWVRGVSSPHGRPWLHEAPAAATLAARVRGRGRALGHGAESWGSSVGPRSQWGEGETQDDGVAGEGEELGLPW
jgi:hypothetical protein